jgi:hypothetical protein
MLLDQLRQFPLAAHDDGPDALEMAVHSSRQLIEYLRCPPVIMRPGPYAPDHPRRTVIRF